MKIALKSDSGRFLTAEGGGTNAGVVSANRVLSSSDDPNIPQNFKTAIGPWETWEVVTVDNSGGGSLDPRPFYAGLLHVDGIQFKTEDGREWIYAGFTDFLLFKRYLDGEDVRPLIQQRKGLGANTLRVLGMVEWGPLRVQDHPEYYDKLASFVALLHDEQIRLEFVVFADAQNLMPNVNEQRDHLRRVNGIIKDFGELVNEYPKNGVDPLAFDKPAGPVLWSRGSGLGDGMPAYPPWDYTTFHLRRDLPKMYLDAQPVELINGWTNFAGMHQPVVEDEDIGASEVDQPGKRSNDPNVFYKLGALHALWNGGTFHSDQGINSELLTGRQLECAKAFFAGITSGAQRP